VPNVNPAQASPFAPSVVFDGSKFHMTWLADDPSNAIYYARSSNGSDWQGVQTLTGQSAGSAPAIALSNNNPVIVYTQTGGDEPYILWSAYDPQVGTFTTAQRANNEYSTSVSAVSGLNGSVLILFRDFTSQSLGYTTIL
jgi:hypothetical protein